MALEPGSILDGWRSWDSPPISRPAIVRQLGGGRSNRSLLLDAGGEKLVLRINGAELVLPSPDRSVEAGVWRAASEAGVAPELLHADQDGKFLVSAYVESDLPVHPQDAPALAGKALALLQRCHQLDVEAPTIDYAAHIERYWRIIGARGLALDSALPEKRAAMRDVLQDIINSGTPAGLCHHDPVMDNFVGTSRRLYLIDWEYAARGLPVMDYAALAVEWGIADEMLTHRAKITPALLKNAKLLYRYMCSLWDLVKVTR